MCAYWTTVTGVRSLTDAFYSTKVPGVLLLERAAAERRGPRSRTTECNQFVTMPRLASESYFFRVKDILGGSSTKKSLRMVCGRELRVRLSDSAYVCAWWLP